MSATRDKSQRIGWSFNNVYELFKGKKADGPVKVNAFEPLQRNLRDLDILHGKLKKMLADLEELTKE